MCQLLKFHCLWVHSACTVFWAKTSDTHSHKVRQGTCVCRVTCVGASRHPKTGLARYQSVSQLLLTHRGQNKIRDSHIQWFLYVTWEVGPTSVASPARLVLPMATFTLTPTCIVNVIWATHKHIVNGPNCINDCSARISKNIAFVFRFTVLILCSFVASTEAAACMCTMNLHNKYVHLYNN